MFLDWSYNLSHLSVFTCQSSRKHLPLRIRHKPSYKTARTWTITVVISIHRWNSWNVPSKLQYSGTITLMPVATLATCTNCNYLQWSQDLTVHIKAASTFNCWTRPTWQNNRIHQKVSDLIDATRNVHLTSVEYASNQILEARKKLLLHKHDLLKDQDLKFQRQGADHTCSTHGYQRQ